MSKKMNRPGSAQKNGPDRSRGDRVETAYRRLRGFIMAGRLAPGSRIIETDIAERLGVSRTPVRTALQRLRQEGFIVSSDESLQARLWVAPLTRPDARELFAILSQCESLAASWVAGFDRVDRAPVVQRLRELNALLETRGRATDPDQDELFGIDREFHSAFFAAAAGPRLKVLHGSVKPQAERYLRLYVNALVERIDESVTEHVRIIDAIDCGDAFDARMAVESNWMAASRRLDAVMERLGERGVW